MNARPTPIHILLAGGGHSHVEVLRRYGMNPIPNSRLTVVSNAYHAPYSGMLPGLIAGHYTFDESHVDLAPLVTHAGARLLHDELTGIDLEGKRAFCAMRPPVPFDLLSINTGSTPAMDDVPGAAEFAIPAKPVDAFIERWQALRERALDAPQPFRFLTVGGGAGGVELTLTMHHYLYTQRAGTASEFHLASDSATILPTHNAGVQRRMRRVFDERGIALHLGQRAVRVTADAVEFDDGTSLPYDALIWVTHAAAPAWIAEAGLATDERGFVAVNEHLQSTSHPFIFAAGDVASLVTGATAKSGVFAVREGPILYDNLKYAVLGEPLEIYRPQRRFLNLISTGDQYAIASRGRWSLEGAWVWRWKDRIDRRWMAKYGDLAPMSMKSMQAADGEAHCGGCGCKLGADVLASAIARLKTEYPEVALDRLDDAAIIAPVKDAVVLQSVDFFRSFVDDPYVFGKIAANHCLNDIFAMGAAPREALAIVTLPYVDEAFAESLLFDMLAGAVEVLSRHACQLVGGHTTEGPELVFGLSVTGYGDEASLWSKSSVIPGDRLVLTKPLGTGAIFAAAMQGKAKGRSIEAAIESMLLSNAHAVAIACEHGATACTDVSGFGLAGHLLEMLRPTQCSATIYLDFIQRLPGAEAEFQSSLYERNARYAGWREPNRDQRILLDPQTSGGLLFAIPSAERAAACVAALRAAGYSRAMDIGAVQSDTVSKILTTFAYYPTGRD